MTPITTQRVPMMELRLTRSRSRKKIAVISVVQMGDVAVMGETSTTGPLTKAVSMNRIPKVSNRLAHINGQKAF